MPLAWIFTRWFLGIKLSDPQNGFRALNRRAVETIKINNREMAHNSEIQTKAYQLNYGSPKYRSPSSIMILDKSSAAASKLPKIC